MSTKTGVRGFYTQLTVRYTSVGKKKTPQFWGVLRDDRGINHITQRRRRMEQAWQDFLLLHDQLNKPRPTAFPTNPWTPQDLAPEYKPGMASYEDDPT